MYTQNQKWSNTHVQVENVGNSGNTYGTQGLGVRKETKSQQYQNTSHLHR
jgi:hypothetical protein